MPGETITSGGVGGVSVALPGGASGRTVRPVRNAKPYATAFLDKSYYAGYPDAQGKPTQPRLKGFHHTGLDINGPGACSADQGDDVLAVRDGVIEYVGPGGGDWGPILILRVVIDGRTWWVRYGHLQMTGKNGKKVSPRAGQTVRAGDVLAFIGRGNWPCAHLHFDVMHTKPPSWGWWPTRYGNTAQVTAYFTDPAAWLERLRAVAA